MKIVVIGTRGIPNVPGGVEKHCEELYQRLSKEHEIILFCRTPYFTTRVEEYRNVKLKYVWCPRSKSFEAIIHSLISLIIARFYSPDIVHIHSIGPALITPLARLAGLKVVFTYHAQDYKRLKWGKLAKLFLKAGEYFGVRFANRTITVSKDIQSTISRTYKKDNIYFIPNGVNDPGDINTSDILKSFGLQPQKYILSVCRFVPEKGLHDLIEAYEKLENKEIKLVFVGDADHESGYSKLLKESGIKGKVIFTGYRKGSELAELFANAGLYVLPSYYEGSPISLLEALSYKIPVLVSDIGAHRAFNLEEGRYFKPGDSSDLSSKVLLNFCNNYTVKERADIDRNLQKLYNWDKIAKATNNIYFEVTG